MFYNCCGRNTSVNQRASDSFHKRSKSHNTQNVGHKRTNSNAAYNINFSNHPEEGHKPEGDRYMVSPNQGMISESFDTHALKTSTTMDKSYKSIKSKAINNNQGISSSINRSGSQYGNDENEGVAASGTWDLRKSSSYIQKGYTKYPKQASHQKKVVTNHK